MIWYYNVMVLIGIHPHLLQVRSWAWAMYRQSWTAYPAGRMTLTCPMPTTPLPPTARTHEGQHTKPCAHPPQPFPSQSPSLSFLPLLHPKDAGRKEGCWHTVFHPHHLSNSPQEEEPILSSLTRSPTPCSPPPPLSLLLLAVALRASICHCYIKDCLLHESNWVRGPMRMRRLGWEEVSGFWKRLIRGMKARVFYPSISCDGGTVGVFTVGTAEGACWRNIT